MKTNLVWWLLVAVFSPMVFGCGTGEYEKRMEARIEQMKKGSAFGAMQPTATLTAAEKSVQVRMAPGLQQPGEADPKRINPPGYKPPGIVATYEGFVADSEGGKIAYYCYVGAEKLKGRYVEHYEHYITNAMTEAFPDATVRWENVDAQLPTGAAVVWEKGRVSVNQEFYYVDPQGTGSYRRMDGFYEIWVRKEGDVLLEVAWRVPTSIAQNAEFDKWAPRVAGSVTLGQ